MIAPGKFCARGDAESVDGFVAGVSPVRGPVFDGWTWSEVVGLVPRNDNGSSIVFIADSVTMTAADHPIHVANISRHRDRRLEPFRCIPSQLWSVENNLNLFNMDWDEFVAATDDDGLFRGF